MLFRSYGADGVSSEFTIDDVEIDITPLCPIVSMLRSPIVKHNEVTLSWVSNNASLWNVKVSTTPMTDMTETADAFDAQTSTNPMVVTGLTPNTLYYVYVQNNCGTDGTGEWSNVYSFTTNCLPINAWPYISNFNDVV